MVCSDANNYFAMALQVSPIEYGHVLLIPRVLDCLPQRIDPESLLACAANGN
jgi:GDP-L-galactose phosphorylase